MAPKHIIIFFSLAFFVSLFIPNQVSSTEDGVFQQEETSSDGNHQIYGVTQGSLHPQECGNRCTSRCSATAYRKPCLFYCNKCCSKCLCVPSGTYGNKHTCPCYENWKTKRGGPKCP